MAAKILHKRSGVSGKTPTSSQMDYGEIAINYAKGSEMISIKNSANEIVSFSPGGGGVNFWKGTLTEYVAIKDKDPDCIYFIVENNINTTD